MTDRRRRARDLVLLLLACFALRAPSFARACLSDDEATYCVVGRELLSGRVLYRDVVDHKPPLIYLTYAATQAVGGPLGGMRLMHLATVLVVFATALLLGRITRRVGEGDPESRAQAPVFAALLYVVFTTTLLDFDALAANCELYMLLPLAGSVLAYARAARGGSRRGRSSFAGPSPSREVRNPSEGSENNDPAWLLAAGALCVVAALYKYQAAVQLPLYALHLALVRRRPRAVAAGWAALAVGAVAVLAACLAIMYRADALAGAWFWFRFNFAYIRDGLRLSELAGRAAVRVSYGIGPALFLWVLGVGAAVRAVRRPTGGGDPARLDRLAAGWLVVSALAVTTGGRFFGHYFHQVTAPLAVLAAPAASRLWASRRRLVVASLALPAAAFFLLGLGHQSLMAAAGAREPDYPALAAFVDAHSRPGDRLAIWGNAPVLYFAAGRPLGSRFVFSNYLTGLSPATRTETDPAADASANVVGESWDMFEADLRARRPRLFIDTSPGNIAAYGKFPPGRFPRLQAILDRDYTIIGEVAGARVLALRVP